MARVTRKEITPPVEPVYEYTLTLSQDEAIMLRTLLGTLKAGSITNPLWQTLKDAGIPVGDYRLRKGDAGVPPELVRGNRW